MNKFIVHIFNNNNNLIILASQKKHDLVIMFSFINLKINYEFANNTMYLLYCYELSLLNN